MQIANANSKYVFKCQMHNLDSAKNFTNYLFCLACSLRCAVLKAMATYHMLDQLKKRNPEYDFCFVIGSDLVGRYCTAVGHSAFDIRHGLLCLEKLFLFEHFATHSVCSLLVCALFHVSMSKMLSCLNVKCQCWSPASAIGRLRG